MTKRILLASLLLLVVVAALAGCTTQTAGDTREDKLRSSANDLVAALARQDYALVEQRFDAPMKEALPREELRAIWERLLNGAGAFQKPTKSQFSREKQGEQVFDVVLVKCQFERAAINTRVVFNQDEQVTGLYFIPASE